MTLRLSKLRDADRKEEEAQTWLVVDEKEKKILPIGMNERWRDIK